MKVFAYTFEGIWLQFFEGDQHVANVPLRHPRAAVCFVSRALIHTVRGAGSRDGIPLIQVEFTHRGGGSLALCFDKTSTSDIRFEFRDYAKAAVMGHHQSGDRYKVVYSGTMPNVEFATLLHDVLRVLSRDILGDMMDHDPEGFALLAEANGIYLHEAPGIAQKNIVPAEGVS